MTKGATIGRTVTSARHREVQTPYSFGVLQTMNMTHSTQLPRSGLDVLRTEIGVLWPADQRGRPIGPYLAIAAAEEGTLAVVGSTVPADVSGRLAALATGPAVTMSGRPPGLARCHALLASAIGPVEIEAKPSYLIAEPPHLSSELTIIRSTDDRREQLRSANPGNWDAGEWADLVDGTVGPWAMAVHSGVVVAICHTPVWNDVAAEAGVWTRPDFRGLGHAAAVTATWAALARPRWPNLFYSTYEANLSSQRVASRLGLRRLGTIWILRPADDA